MSAERPWRAWSRSRWLWTGLALAALALAAALWHRDPVPPDLRELYREYGRQQLLVGDWRRALVFLEAAYRDADADAGLRFLVARAAAPLRGGDDARRRTVTLATAAGGWSSAELSDDWRRLVAVDTEGKAAVFDPVDGERVADLAGVEPDLARARFSPDGVHVAGLHAGGGLSWWRRESGELVFSRPPASGVTEAAVTEVAGTAAGAPEMAFSADGRSLLAVTASGTVTVWDLGSGSARASFKVGPGGAFAFAPGGRRLISLAGGVAMIWNLDTGKPIVSLDLPRDAAVSSLVYSPDGERVLTAGDPPEVRVFDAADGELELLLTGHQTAVRHAAWSPGGDLILTAAADGTARVWDVERGLPLAVLPLPPGEVIHAGYGSAGVATLHADGTLDLRWLALEHEHPAEIRRLRRCFVPWRLDSGRLLPATPDPLSCRRIRPRPEDDPDEWDDWVDDRGPDERGPGGGAAARSSWKPAPLPIVVPAMISGRVVDLAGAPIAGAEIRLWSRGTALATLRHDDAVLAVAWSPNGERLVTGCRDGGARTWELAGGALGEALRHGGAVTSAAWSPDGRRLATASADGAARLWASGLALGEPMRHGSAVRSVAWSPGGRRLATASTDGTARLWQAASGKSLGEPLFHHAFVVSAAWSPDGRRLATAAESAARIWELTGAGRGRRRASPIRHPGLRAASFSPDGRRLLTTAWDGSLRLWWVADEPATGPPSGALLDDRAPVAAWSPGGRRLATAGWDGAVRVWRLSEPIDEVVGQHQAAVHALAWSPDGRWLASASEDGTAQVWNASGSPEAEGLRDLLPPVATSDGEGNVRFEIDRTRRPAFLVSHAGYLDPPAHALPIDRVGSSFVAELSDTAAPSRLRDLRQTRAEPHYGVGVPVSLSLAGADLLETLRSFATIGDINLLFAPGIEGTLDLELSDVPWDWAFEEILRTHDLSLIACCSPAASASGWPILALVVPRDGRTLGPESSISVAGLIRPLPSARTTEPPSGFLEPFVDIPASEDPAADAGAYAPPPADAGRPSAGRPSAGRPVGVSDVALFEAAAARASRPPVYLPLGEPIGVPRGEPIDMSFRDGDLVETLRSFATIDNRQWTIDPDVRGTLSAELKGLPWDLVLAGVLRLHDLSLEVDGRHARIRRRDGGRRPPPHEAEP